MVLEQGKNLSLLNVNAFQAKINNLYTEFGAYLKAYNIDLASSIIDIEGLTKNSVEAIPALLNSIGSILGSITLGILSVLFITFFLLKDGEYFEKIFILLFPSRMKKRIEKSLLDVKALLTRGLSTLCCDFLLLCAERPLVAVAAVRSWIRSPTTELWTERMRLRSVEERRSVGGLVVHVEYIAPTLCLHLDIQISPS